MKSRFWCRAQIILTLMGASLLPSSVRAQEPVTSTGDSISFRFIDSDIRAVASSLAPYLGKPLLQSGVQANRVTLETSKPVPRGTVVAMLRGVAEGIGLEFVEDSLTFRLRPRPPDPVPVAVASGVGGSIELHVIRLHHARAPEIAASINLLFGNGGEFGGRSGMARSSLSAQLRATAGPAPTAPSSTPEAQGATLAGQVTIVPDEVTNSLLIRASAGDFALISGAVDQLDIRPLQVLIEVLIVEARKDHDFTLGTDATLPPQRLRDGSTVGGNYAGGGVGDLVVNMMHLGRSDVNVVIRTAESRGDVEILSRPVIIAANNTEATFMVGSQRPFVSVSRALPNEGATQDRVVTYRDVGTRLTVLPTISFDGYVSLEIMQEINQATTEIAFEAPVISTREAHTNVLVKDGQTIVIGGLRDKQHDRSAHGVPILSQIPFIGGLFGGISRHSSETELYLFLTPRILRTDADVEQATTARMPDRAKEAP